MPGPKKIIIDCDTGVDDAQAIMCALSRPDLVEVIAITCVQGNVDLFNVCQNTLRVLKVCDRLDIPVYKGSDKSLVGIGPGATYYHGRDGMGDADNHEEVDLDLMKTEPAAIALIRLVNEFPDEITLIALAPLTNVALALRLDPNFGRKLKDIAIMGGNIEGKGNTSPASEFNFRCDPESAHVVLKELGCPKLIVSWEVCLDNGQPWSWFENWINTDTKKGRFQHSILQHSIMRLRQYKRKYYTSCDLLAMCVFLDKTVATKVEEIYVEVELQGRLTRGQMVCDWRGTLEKPTNAVVVKAVDKEKLQRYYDAMLQ